jgi:hypothetical protein
VKHENAAGAYSEGAKVVGEEAASEKRKLGAAVHRRRFGVARRGGRHKLTRAYTILARLEDARAGARYHRSSKDGSLE